MITPDTINAIFETGGGIAVTYNCIRLWRDRAVNGISITSQAWFSTWGLWNIYFYWYYDHTYSWYAAIFLASVNSLWVVMAIYFTYFDRKQYD